MRLARFQRVSTAAQAGGVLPTAPARPTAGSSISKSTTDPSAPSARTSSGVRVSIVQPVAGVPDGGELAGGEPAGDEPAGGGATSSWRTVVATVAGAGS